MHVITRVVLVPLHKGHHPIWGSALYDVDICNMVDDVVVRSNDSIYRFPIDEGLLPWLRTLIGSMNDYDCITQNHSSGQNATTRTSLVEAATRRLAGESLQLNTFEPGPVSPALVSGGTVAVDLMLSRIVGQRPEALVP
jgi:hypothetical protein